MNTLTRWLVLASCLCCPLRVLSTAIPVDGTTAVVNGHVVTMTEVLQVMQPVQRHLSQKYSGKELSRKLEEAYERTLNSLIDRQVILDTYNNQEEFLIPDTVVTMQIDELIHTKFHNNRAEFIKALESDGMSLEEWRTEIKNRMIVAFMRKQAVESKVSVSPQAVRDIYKKSIDKYQAPAQVELRMIVIHRGSTDQEITLKSKQASDVRKRLVAGEDFGDLARQVSEGVKASVGGYWGWIEPGSRRAELAEVLSGLNPGEISEITEASEDLYILKVEARKNASVTPFEDVRKSIQTELEQEEGQRLYEAWIARLKKKSYIKKY
ncbi:peptidylprolyl isomerase [Verrucomicrobiota bacterium]